MGLCAYLSSSTKLSCGERGFVELCLRVDVSSWDECFSCDEECPDVLAWPGARGARAAEDADHNPKGRVVFSAVFNTTNQFLRFLFELFAEAVL